MPRIQLLAPSVTTKIAAGEVIERPASVVKELLENAVDAGASRIDLEVEQGGTELIRVVDNGCGIEAEDLRLAFASHATSKLRDAEDLFHIGSLGFRGEALASIGGVTQTLLQSRVPRQDFGAEIRCEGGELSDVKPWGGSVGTRLEVRHLFFNTPVRRKFLRSPPTEMGHVTETFTRLALAHLGIHWTLAHNDRTVHEMPASAGLSDRIATFFGNEVSGRLFDLRVEQGAAVLHGFIADPQLDRGNARMQYVFVNRRWIRDRSIAHAIQEAYRGILMTGRYAVTFLFLDLPPDQVDVNVHPTKSEVRFRDPNAIHHLVHAGIRERLRKEHLTARLMPTSTLAPPRPPEFAAGTTNGFPPWTLTAPASAPPLPFTTSQPAPPVEGGAPAVPTVSASVPPSQHFHHRSPSGHRAFQLYDTYLVAETDEGMLVIDQHALHERILFEQLKERLREGRIDRQQLLIPEPVDLPPEQVGRALEHRDALADLGLEIEPFGGDTILLRTAPAVLARAAPATVLRAVVDHLSAKERVPNREVFLNDLLSLVACHSAVRAGDRLPPEEIAALLEQRSLVDDTHHCPHGRPTALLFSRADLERQFGRI
jgi:DNA mismatch repair protein MutL